MQNEKCAACGGEVDDVLSRYPLGGSWPEDVHGCHVCRNCLNAKSEDTIAAIRARKSPVVTLGECDVGDRVELVRYMDPKTGLFQSSFVGHTFTIEVKTDDDCGPDWCSLFDNSWEVRRLPKEQPKTLRDWEDHVVRDCAQTLTRIPATVRRVDEEQPNEKASGLQGDSRNVAECNSQTTAEVPKAHAACCDAAPPEGMAQGGQAPRWFNAPSHQHAALEAILAEQVSAGGHDTEYARRQIVNRAKLQMAMTETKYYEAPRLSRSELPSVQRRDWWKL